MTLYLKYDDIEIEILAPGPIIHIFPDIDPTQAQEDIVKSLIFFNNFEKLYSDLQSVTDNQANQEDKKLFSFIKEQMDKAKKETALFFDEKEKQKPLGI